MEKECVIVIMQKENLTETRVIGDKGLALEYVKNEAAKILTS